MNVLILCLYLLVFVLAYSITIGHRLSYLLSLLIMILFILAYTIPVKLVNINGKHFTPIYNTYTLYHSFHHGDIVFSTNSVNIWDLLAINNGIVHSGIIIEEHGIKYMIHSWSGSVMNKKKIIYSYNYIGLDWKVIKEPLLQYLLEYKKCHYQIFRQPSTIKPITISKKCIRTTSRYCSEFVGIVLHNQGIIKKSSYPIFPYRPYEIIEGLLAKGYTCLFLKHG